MKRFFEHHCTLSNTMRTTLMDRSTPCRRALIHATMWMLWPMQDTDQQQTSLQRMGSNGKALLPEQPRHAQNCKELLPYLWGLQHSHGVGHSRKRLICLLDIDGKFVASVWGWGTRLYRGFKCQGVENWGVRGLIRVGQTKRQRSNNAWRESMQWTCVLWLQRWGGKRKTRGGWRKRRLYKRWSCTEIYRWRL